MGEKETLLRNNIDVRRQQIADGVSAETKERMLKEIEGYEEELKGLLAEEQRTAEQEKKIAEVDSMEFDFDADFGTEGLNNLVRQMIKDERTKSFTELNAAQEREIQLQRQAKSLQNALDTALQENKEKEKEIARLISNHQDTVTRFDEANSRMAEVEQNRVNAVTLFEEANAEIERLGQHIDDLRKQIAVGERQSQHVIDVTETVANLYEQAKQATAEKRKVMVTAELGLYREIQGEDGSKETIHHSALEGLEVVPSFPEPPPLEQITDIPEAILRVEDPFRQQNEIPGGLGELEGGTDQGVSEVTRIEFEELKARVDILFANQDRREVA